MIINTHINKKGVRIFIRALTAHKFIIIFLYLYLENKLKKLNKN